MPQNKLPSKSRDHTPVVNDEEDDYTSDKFINQAGSAPAPSTLSSYGELRKRKFKESAQKVEAHNKKNRSRREMEEDSRREGLSKSLFDRAREEEAIRKENNGYTNGHASSSKGKEKDIRTPSTTNGHHSAPTAGVDQVHASAEPPVTAARNKAFAMMLKMGFKEGQTLGRRDYMETPATIRCIESMEANEKRGGGTPDPPPTSDPSEPPLSAVSKLRNIKQISNHLVEPLPLAVWAGRKGLGAVKRTFVTDSDSDPGRASKVLKVNGGAVVADPKANLDEEAFRNRAKEEYQERRASGRIASARKTLIHLDENKDIKFHKLWIDPHDIATVPKEILPHLELIDDQFGNQRFPLPILRHDVNDDRGDERERLRRRMLADSLQPRAPLEADAEDADPASELVPEDADKIAHMDIDDATVQEIQTFVLSGAQERLKGTLSYLRDTHTYCFWCGVSYNSAEDMKTTCPGEDEDDHD